MRIDRTDARGSTLIELIAVMVMLAILSGVALPKFFDLSSQARESALKGAVNGVRAGLANFYANQAVTGEPRYPTYDELSTLAIVMEERIPDNPYNDSNEVRDADGKWRPDYPPVTGADGWAYDSTNGRFWANSDEVDENTW